MNLEKENLQLKIKLVETTAQFLQFQLNALGVDHQRLLEELEKLEGKENGD